MIRFENPVCLTDGVDIEEYQALRKLLLDKRLAGEDWVVEVQIEGYGEDLHPKEGFCERFDATLRMLKDDLIKEGHCLYGSYSESDPYEQPFDCWRIAIYDYAETPWSELEHLKLDFSDHMTSDIKHRIEALEKAIKESGDGR